MTHRDVAIQLLVGRAKVASGEGLPWSWEEDQRLIALERQLWGELSEAERGEDQAWLTELWRRGAPGRRVLEGWVIPDEAFSMTLDGGLRAGRPMGVGGGDFEQWLWSKGFQVVDRAPGGGRILIGSTVARFMAESVRLAGLMAREGWSGKVQGVYDPVLGQGSVEVTLPDVKNSSVWTVLYAGPLGILASWTFTSEGAARAKYVSLPINGPRMLLDGALIEQDGCDTGS